MKANQGQDGRKRIADDEVRAKIILAVCHQGMFLGEAAEKFGVPKAQLKLWIRLHHDRMASGKFSQRAKNAVPGQQFDDDKKRQIAAEINGGFMRISDACRAYGVSRHYVNTWVSSNTGANLEITTSAVYYSMTPEQKNKELEERLRIVQKQLEEARLKISGLETLIEVAEEKFEIQIKKKPGTKPPKK